MPVSQLLPLTLPLFLTSAPHTLNFSAYFCPTFFPVHSRPVSCCGHHCNAVAVVVDTAASTEPQIIRVLCLLCVIWYYICCCYCGHHCDDDVVVVVVVVTASSAGISASPTDLLTTLSAERCAAAHALYCVVVSISPASEGLCARCYVCGSAVQCS